MQSESRVFWGSCSSRTFRHAGRGSLIHPPPQQLSHYGTTTSRNKKKRHRRRQALLLFATVVAAELSTSEDQHGVAKHVPASCRAATTPGFGPLRVINKDRMRVGRGFGRHGHINYWTTSTHVVSGALEHHDSTGNREVLRRGDVRAVQICGHGHTPLGDARRQEEARALPADLGAPDRRGYSTLLSVVRNQTVSPTRTSTTSCASRCLPAARTEPSPSTRTRTARCSTTATRR